MLSVIKLNVVMLSVTYKLSMLSVIMLSVIMLSEMAPILKLGKQLLQVILANLWIGNILQQNI